MLNGRRTDNFVCSNIFGIFIQIILLLCLLGCARSKSSQVSNVILQINCERTKVYIRMYDVSMYNDMCDTCTYVRTYSLIIDILLCTYFL